MIPFFQKTVDSYTNKDLAHGVSTGTEIMIQGKEYFAVSLQYQRYLEDYFKKYGIKTPTEEMMKDTFNVNRLGTTLEILKT